MTRFSIICLMVIVTYLSYAQELGNTLGKKIDDLTYSWDLESDNLDDYQGMQNFCQNTNYRNGVLDMLTEIHHYDSLLLFRLRKASRFSVENNVKKVLKDITKFEQKYSMRDFVEFLSYECAGIKEIEENKIDLLDEIAQESYDGKRYVLETELAKYIHHITHRVDAIRKHVHDLHIN